MGVFWQANRMNHIQELLKSERESTEPLLCQGFWGVVKKECGELSLPRVRGDIPRQIVSGHNLPVWIMKNQYVCSTVLNRAPKVWGQDLKRSYETASPRPFEVTTYSEVPWQWICRKSCIKSNRGEGRVAALPLLQGEQIPTKRRICRGTSLKWRGVHT